MLSGKTSAGSVGVSVTKNGYYGSSGYGAPITNLNFILHRWEPWNPTIEVALKLKGIQVPMSFRKISQVNIPAEGKPIGFDLMVGDWVPPYGKGQVPDFHFQLDELPRRMITNWWGTNARPHPLTDNKLTISFSNAGDGIQSVFAPLRGTSELRLPRQAPPDGYEPVLSKHNYDEILGVEKGSTQVRRHTDFQKDQNYFFRVRTQKDTQGNIVSALYGKIDGDFNDGHFIGRNLSFTYYLNPEPNSRNMEFDPKQNLAR